MRMMERYLVRQFMRVFVMTFVSLLGVYVVADFVTNLSRFMALKDSTDSFGSQLAYYYAARRPWFFEISGRIVMLLSAVFVVSLLQKHNEMTALMAAGISRWRIVRPLILAGILFAILAAVNRETTLPRFREPLCRTVKDMLENQARTVRPRYDNETDVLFEGRAVYLAENRIEQPRLRLPRTWGPLGRTLRAREAIYTPVPDGWPPGYLLKGIDKPELVAQQQSLWLQDRPLVLSPHDQDHLQADEVYVVSNMPIDFLYKGRRWNEFSSTAQLMHGFRGGSIDRSADMQILLHRRFVQPAMDMTLLFLGLPAVVMGHQRRVLLSAGKSLLIVGAFSLIVLFCHAAGMQAAISPVLSVWLPLLLLVPLAFLLSRPLRC